MAFFLHERQEVPCDVGVTLALKFFLPVVVRRTSKHVLVEILEGLLLEFDGVPFHELHRLFCFSQHFILHVQAFDEEPIVDYGSRRVFVLVEGLDCHSDDLAFDILRQEGHPRPEGVVVVFQVRLELVQRQKGRRVLLKPSDDDSDFSRKYANLRERKVVFRGSRNLFDWTSTAPSVYE